jgi:hypothetical protein
MNAEAEANLAQCPAVVAPSIFYAERAAQSVDDAGMFLFVFLNPTDAVQQSIERNDVVSHMSAGVLPGTYAAKAVFIKHLVEHIEGAPEHSPLLSNIIAVMRDRTHEAACGLYNSVAETIFQAHSKLQVLTFVFHDASLSVVYTRNEIMAT